MDDKEKVAMPCHDNQLLLEFARGQVNAWKRRKRCRKLSRTFQRRSEISDHYTHQY